MSGEGKKANIWAIMGATGGGKGNTVKKFYQKAKPKRSIIWDGLHDFNEHGVNVQTLTELHNAITTTKGFKKNFNIVFKPDLKYRNPDVFNLVCKLAYGVGDMLFIADELKHVTSPTNAPMWWSEMNTSGRHKGLSIIGTSQRPAQIDKDFFSNATHIRAFRVNYSSDVKVLADVMKVKQEEVSGLPMYQHIERDMLTGETTRGQEKEYKPKKS